MPSRGLGGRARRRRASRRRREAAEARDWAGGLGTDALLAVLGRLGHLDILMSADRVCRSWRRAARDEPSLWRRVALRGDERIARRLDRCGAACEAVRRSAGQCEAFRGEHAGDDGFLIYLSEQAPRLKSLRLISCNGVTNEGLIEAVKKFPLLEEIELSLCDNVGDCVYNDLGEVCPQLKHFRLSKHRFDITVWYRDNTRGIANMHGLRSLQLFSTHLTNQDLETILDNCPQLESLDIRHCFNVDMDEALLLKCARIKTLRLPEDPTDDYDLPVQSPVRTYVREDIVWSSEDYYRSGGHYESEDSGDDSDFYGEPSRYESDLDTYEKMLPLSMRTLL